MKMCVQFVVVLVLLLAVDRPAVAADKPSDLIVGKWKIHNSEPGAFEFFEFLKDGSGAISSDAAMEKDRVPISWKITKTYGNACVLVVKYDEAAGKLAKPIPKKAVPFTWLIAFDGSDTFVTVLRQNEIWFLDRQSGAKPIAGGKVIPE